MTDDEHIDEILRSMAFRCAGGITEDGRKESEPAKAAIKKLLLEARLSELEVAIDHYTPYRPFLDSEKSKEVRAYLQDRIQELTKEANSL